MQRLYRIGEVGDVRVVELFLRESLDEMEFDQLNEAMLSSVDTQANGSWVLDLTGSSYMGSAVLGLLVNVRQRIKQGHGGLVLCGLSSRLEEIFQACCMERLFLIVKSREDAVEMIKR
ncbi:MAG TPA: STAS domain-containing protein [Tepidisphaeraceae bacterium]|nr:STAS domain-containing protein [Tepidisphaeraceae bacterium]